MRLVHAVYEPAGDGPFPTVVALHGWGSNAMDLLGLAPYLAGGHCLTICPQGSIEIEIGAINGFGWYPIQPGRSADEEKAEAAVDELFRCIDETVRRYPVDERKLVILGFSQGGMMAYRLAMRMPRRFAALVGIATAFPEGLAAPSAANQEALQSLPTLVQHGRADTMLNVTRARESVELLRNLKLSVTYLEYDCGHEVTAESMRDLSAFLVEKVIEPPG